MLKLSAAEGQGNVVIKNNQGVAQVQNTSGGFIQITEGMIDTIQYTFNGTYVFEYEQWLSLLNVYGYPTDLTNPGYVKFNLLTGEIKLENFTGAYMQPAWMTDLRTVLLKKSFDYSFSLARADHSVDQSAVEQTNFLSNGTFDKSIYANTFRAPTVLGDKVKSVNCGSITLDQNWLVFTCTNYAKNNVYVTFYGVVHG